MPEPLLRIRNHHIPASGDPLIIDGETENKYGHVGFLGAGVHGITRLLFPPTDATDDLRRYPT